jgi:lipopolysaccharide/colanic/teichoic acid biosynthesis glycosyltransferase
MTRLLDVVFSGLALFVLAPLLLPVALVLRFTGEGEVFYRQDRVGKDGRRFGLLKFATMLKDSPNIGPGLLTVKDDPRVLPVGRFLRKTKINELPQLINILRGEMSVIGPRPQAPRHFDVFPEHVKREIVKTRPGLSGIGSIVFRDEEELLARNAGREDAFYRDVIARYKGELELWYLHNQGVGLYLLLIALTVWVVLFPASTAYRRLLPGLPATPEQLHGL